jgi:prepilin-type N-terminal cleavage/methylation domain-containing protein
MTTVPASSARRHSQAGFTLVELLVSMAITTIVVGTTMVALNDAIRATESATLMTGMNNGLRTTMDLVVRDLLQVGQGLPSGNVISVPSGAGATAVRLPGPPGTAYTMPAGATGISAVIPGPGLGPTVNNVQTDIITTIAADSAFEHQPLSALAADGLSMTVAPSVSISNGGPDDLHPGDLIMLTKSSFSTLVQITRISGQQVFFEANDSLNLNQPGAADGTVLSLRAEAPADTPNAQGIIPTEATRIRMVSFYLDVTTDPRRPRLVRRMNNGDPLAFNNNLGTAVAFDIENLQITYDLSDGTTNPTNVDMDGIDVGEAGTGTCAPDPCSPNQIRKVNVQLSGRSRAAMRGTNQYFRNQLLTQVSLRSLAFVDRYR